MEPAADPALSVALALAAGILAQSLARHPRIPGIVILLGVGAALGPEGLGWNPLRVEHGGHSGGDLDATEAPSENPH